jgi:LPS export ABC transporter permease LptG
MPLVENASRTESQNPGIGWPSVIEIIARPSHPAIGPLPSSKFHPSQHARHPRPHPANLPPKRPFMHFLRSHSKHLALFLALIALGAGLCALILPAEYRSVEAQLLGFPDSDVRAHKLRPAVLVMLCFLPALACLVYSLGGILDRYITRQFLGIFGICLSALFSMWLLIDLSDKIGDFRSTEDVVSTILTFYITRSPAIFLLLLPYSLLLALLYSLGKLSTHREIISMIQSGRGVIRITLPLIIAGAFCTLFSMGLNYHWAPIAEGRQNEIIARANSQETAKASQVLFRNPDSRRLWMIGAFPPDYEKGRPLRNIEVTTTTADHQIKSRISASQATWDRETRRWTFENPVVRKYSPGEAPLDVSPPGALTMDAWSETPWQLIKPGLRAAYMGIPDLNTWLRDNAMHQQYADPSPYLTQWHYRWALPFTCLVTVLLATPLAIHFSRRGAGGGVFLAVVLSALMLLISNIILALGEAGTLNPALAAWLPNLTFTLLGLYLFRRRITGRPIYHSLRRCLPNSD